MSEITLHNGQSLVYNDLFRRRACRYAVVCCSRGWGKSYGASVAAMTAVHELIRLPADVPNKTVWIIAPTFDQVREIYYPLLQFDLGCEQLALTSSRALGEFTFANNVTLRLLSYESVERMRGKGAYFVVWDEVSSCHKGITAKEAWEAVISPCITTRWSRQSAARFDSEPGRALIISTPKGYNYFHELWSLGGHVEDWKSYHFDFTTSPYLDPAEIENARHTLDLVTFASEYLAAFRESGANVFYAFDRAQHVVADLEYFKPGEDVHVGIDFNVGLQCSSAFAIRGGHVHYLDDFQGHPDTETLAKALSNKYKGHRIYAYPDPSGNSRKTSAPVGQTDFSILRSHGITVCARRAAPSIKDSVAAVNRKLMTAAGTISMFFHPRCKNLIRSMERTVWAGGRSDTAVIDKSVGAEHHSDAVRYPIEYLYPVLSGTSVISTGFNF